MVYSSPSWKLFLSNQMNQRSNMSAPNGMKRLQTLAGWPQCRCGFHNHGITMLKYSFHNQQHSDNNQSGSQSRAVVGAVLRLNTRALPHNICNNIRLGARSAVVYSRCLPGRLGYQPSHIRFTILHVSNEPIYLRRCMRQ